MRHSLRAILSWIALVLVISACSPKEALQEIAEDIITSTNGIGATDEVEEPVNDDIPDSAPVPATLAEFPEAKKLLNALFRNGELAVYDALLFDDAVAVAVLVESAPSDAIALRALARHIVDNGDMVSAQDLLSPDGDPLVMQFAIPDEMRHSIYPDHRIHELLRDFVGIEGFPGRAFLEPDDTVLQLAFRAPLHDTAGNDGIVVTFLMLSPTGEVKYSPLLYQMNAKAFFDAWSTYQ